MPPRPRRRRGYIEPLPSGSFRAVVYAGTDPLTREDIRLPETSRPRVEAEKALVRLQGQVDDNPIPSPYGTRTRSSTRSRPTCGHPARLTLA